MNTIVALSTPPMKSTIHIIRLSGPETYNIINKICVNKVEKIGHSIQNNKIINKKNNKIIDDVLLMKFTNPKSFTGEDLIEINCHGNLIIVNKIIKLILESGAIMAQPGEFTKQAFINNKLDISQANSINYLINAKTDFQTDVSLNIILGNAKNKIRLISEKLFQIIGTLEVNIDYPEYYDVHDVKSQEVKKTINEIYNDINEIITSYNNNYHLFNGINLVILGKPNSGKSSLLNAILKMDRAIVSDIPGTTRDFIKESINIDGLNFNIIDTAGIRDSNNKIENIGINKAVEISKNADLILYVIDNSISISKDELDWINKNIHSKFIIVKNKEDLEDNNSNLEGIKISAKNNKIDNLKKEIFNIFKLNNDGEFFITSDYEKNILLDINNNLDKANELIEEEASLDLIISFLEYSYKLLKTFLGEEKDFDLLDELFKNFCLGK
ncbi:MAG: tRNA uridine-5-carboxymethylaminomethyl(34) synthesis GTPase MnmE [Mycoplasmoidaceae bacterium]